MRLIGFSYRGGKKRIAKLLVSMMPPSGERLVEPFAGRASVSMAAMQLSHYKSYWLNETKLETLNFLVMLRSINPDLYPLKVRERSKAEQRKLRVTTYESVFTKWLDEAPKNKQADIRFVLNKLREQDNDGGDLTAPFEALAEPFHSFSHGTADGGGFTTSIRGGISLRSYLHNLKQAHELMRNNDIKFTRWDYRRVLRECKPSDVVFLDPPYANGCNPGVYDASTVDHREMVRTLLRAKYRWVLTEYEDPIYRTLGEPIRVATTNNHNQPRTECIWSNFDVLHYALERMGNPYMGKETEELVQKLEKTIEEAQAAIRAIRRAEAVQGISSPQSSSVRTGRAQTARKKRNLSPEARKKLSEAAKKRWAYQKKGGK